MKAIKKIVSLALCAAITANMLVSSVSASSYSGTGESRFYNYKGYTVEYKVVNEWTGNQNIEIIVTNTGDELLTDWSVGYNASGKINGLWNAQIYAEQGTEYILKSAGYNSEIAPGQSVNFGYMLSGDNFKYPQNIFNCSKRVDITDNYDVYYNIAGDYGSTYQAEMVIENVSDTDYSSWQLSFEGNVTIDNLWNGKLIENNNGSFKVKNAEHNPVIYAGDSVSFNFGGTRLLEDKDDTEVETDYEIIFENYKLTAVVIPVEFDFEFDPELDSDEDGIPDYIERGLGIDRNNPDTDGDGLPDGYEYYYLGTDPAKIDSDDNGISDADEDFDEEGLTNIEEYNLSTNPFVKDSDYDGLSDYDEVYKYNTDPTKNDTDEDKVTDGDEVILGLDPNNPATFGYPDSEYTTEQTVEIDSSALQNINNLEDNPFTISVDITAAGVADNCLTADESGYSYPILQNDAVLGVVPELSYSDGLTVSDVIINFNIVDSAVSDRIGAYSDDPNFDGINRFNVFKYFEEDNILLPIETFYDETENRVYTHVDRVGTYCLIDMEKWINNIENTPAGNYYEESDNEPANIVFCLDTRDIIDSDSFNDIKANIKTITDDAFGKYDDIKVYVYYQRFGSNFKVTNNLLSDSKTGENYFTCYEDAEAALDRLERYLIKSNFWAYDYVEATQFMIDTCDENIIAMYHITADDRVMGSVSGAKKLLQTVQNSKYTTGDEEEINRIYVSLICPNSDKVIDPDSYAAQLVETSGGVIYTAAEHETETPQATKKVRALRTADVTDNEDEKLLITPGSFADTVRDNVTGILGEGNGNEYKVITSTGLTTIKLDKPLTKDSTTDTDHDDRSDWEEVNTDLVIKIYADKHYGDITIVDGKWRMPTYLLPTYEEIIQNYNELFYVKGGLGKWLENSSHGGNPYPNIRNVKILPIFSNPVDADSDNDGIPDFCDKNKLYKGNGYYDLDVSKLGDKFIFTVTHDFNSPLILSQREYNQINVYSLPKESSPITFIYNYNSQAKIYVHSIVKTSDGIWLRIKNNWNGKMGYVKWNGTKFDDNTFSYQTIQRLIPRAENTINVNTLYERMAKDINESIAKERYIESEKDLYDYTLNKTVLLHTELTKYDQKIIQNMAYTDEETGIRYVEIGKEKPAYLIAAGTLLSAFVTGESRCGDVFKVTWEDQTYDYVCIGDTKGTYYDGHTKWVQETSPTTGEPLYNSDGTPMIANASNALELIIDLRVNTAAANLMYNLGILGAFGKHQSIQHWEQRFISIEYMDIYILS